MSSTCHVCERNETDTREDACIVSWGKVQQLLYLGCGKVELAAGKTNFRAAQIYSPIDTPMYYYYYYYYYYYRNSPRNRPRRPRGGVQVALALSLTSAPDGVGSQSHAPVALPPGKKPGSHCTGGWVGSRADLGGCRPSGPHRDYCYHYYYYFN